VRPNLSLCCLLLFCVSLAIPDGMARAEVRGEIAVVVGADQDTQRVGVYDVGAGKLTLVGPGNCDGAPIWSPDGSRLAFHTKEEGKLGIYVCYADGSNAKRLAHAHPWNQDPRWSADGKRLAYTVGIEDGPATGVAVYDLANDTETFWGGEQKGLMRPVFLPNTNLLLALKPDDTEKAFDDPVAAGLLGEALGADSVGTLLSLGIVGAGKLSTEIFVVTPGFALPVLPLVPGGGNSARYAEWQAEPNAKGDRIAFESNSGGDREIFVLGKRGVSNVTNQSAADWAPTWAPDGRTLAFESFRSGRRGVYRVFTDTVRVLPVVVLENADAFAPAWAPDGKSLACTSTETGEARVCLVDVKSGKRTALPLTEPTDGAAWRPSVKK
jgi:Tol biopolymer transport system component